MKQRRLGLLAGLALLAILVLGCGGAAGARGWASPARVGDVLLVSTGRGHIDGLNAATREQVWRFPDFWDVQEKGARDLKGVYGAPVTGRDNRTVFFGDYNGYVYAFRPSEANIDAKKDADKPKAASVKLPGPVIGGVTLDSASGFLFVAAGKGVYKLQSSQLAAKVDNRDTAVDVALLFETEGEIWGQPLLADGKVLISSLDGNLYAIEQASGREVWRFTGERALASTPALASGTVLVGGFDRRLHAIDAATGTRKWFFEAADWIWSRPAVEGSLAYFGDFDGKLYGVNIASGAAAWEIQLDKGAIRSGPVLSGNVLVVATETGWLVGVDPATHTLRWQTKIDSSLTADLVAGDDGTVLIAPSGCVTLATEEKAYYVAIDPLNGDLKRAGGAVCR